MTRTFVVVAAITALIVSVGASSFGCGLDLQANGDDASDASSSPIVNEAGAVGDGQQEPQGPPCQQVSDCTNPACTCVAPPAGWSVIGVVSESSSGTNIDGGTTSPTTCPSGWTNGRWLRVNPHSGAACACSCGAPASNPCTNGTMPASLDGNLSNGDDFCNDGNATLNMDGTCHTVDFDWNTSDHQWAGISGSPPASKTVSCGANAEVPPILDDGAVSVCDPPAGANVPTPSTIKACIQHADDEPTCPAGYPKRHVVIDAVDDSRKCGACDCSLNAASCATPTVTFYSDTNCATNVRTASIALVIATDVCNRITGNVATVPKAYKYTATPSSTTCAAKSATSALSGTLTPKSTITVCCP